MIENKEQKNRWYKPQKSQSQSETIACNELQWSVVNTVSWVLYSHHEIDMSMRNFADLIDPSHSLQTSQYPNLMCPFELGMLKRTRISSKDP